jgi:hypothetical protein
MAANVLRSKRAVQMSVFVVREVAIKSQKQMSGQTTQLRGINTQYESIG